MAALRGSGDEAFGHLWDIVGQRSGGCWVPSNGSPNVRGVVGRSCDGARMLGSEQVFWS